MLRLICTILFSLFFSLAFSANFLNNNAQNVLLKDSLNAKSVLKKTIIPVSLISIGAIINNSHFEKQTQINIRNKVGNDFESKIDDYFQYIPIIEMYAADALGVKSKNHWFDQSKYLLISNLISSGITHGLKRGINKTRPDGSPHAFPSGHTSFAFTNATVLFNEFKSSSPILAYSGYAFATTTGTFRVLNNKHWISDVLVGAGIGILVTELVYYFEPLKNFNPFKKDRDIILIPTINKNNQFGIFFSYNF